MRFGSRRRFGGTRATARVATSLFFVLLGRGGVRLTAVVVPLFSQVEPFHVERLRQIQVICFVLLWRRGGRWAGGRLAAAVVHLLSLLGRGGVRLAAVVVPLFSAGGRLAAAVVRLLSLLGRGVVRLAAVVLALFSAGGWLAAAVVRLVSLLGRAGGRRHQVEPFHVERLRQIQVICFVLLWRRGGRWAGALLAAGAAAAGARRLQVPKNPADVAVVLFVFGLFVALFFLLLGRRAGALLPGGAAEAVALPAPRGGGAVFVLGLTVPLFFVLLGRQAGALLPAGAAEAVALLARRGGGAGRRANIAAVVVFVLGLTVGLGAGRAGLGAGREGSLLRRVVFFLLLLLFLASHTQVLQKFI